MSNKNIISVGLFKFRVEPTFIEERRIKSVMAEISGGWSKLAELEAQISEMYEKHIEHNKKALGSEFVQKHTRFLQLNALDIEEKLSKDEKKELAEIKKTLNNNIHYKKYNSLLQEKIQIYNYAFMQVMVEEPQDYDFMNLTEEALLDILNQFYIEKKNMNQPAKAEKEQTDSPTTNEC